MAKLPSVQDVGNVQKLIIKNPIAFVAAIFCIAFGFTYYININKNSDAEQYYKELYEAERNRNDRLTTELLINKGVIRRQEEVIIKADSTLKDNVSLKVDKILNNENN